MTSPNMSESAAEREAACCPLKLSLRRPQPAGYTSARWTLHAACQTLTGAQGISERRRGDACVLKAPTSGVQTPAEVMS